MARVKRAVAAKRKHKSVFKLAKGYRHGRKNVYRQAKQAVDKAAKNAYRGRKLKKRYFRSLWIVRLNAALKSHEIKYSEFIDALKKNNVTQNRKELSRLAIEKPEEFAKIVEKAKA